MFVVLDNLSIVTSSLWHSKKKYIHNSLFMGNQEQCKQFVSNEATRLLSE
jgi:hypothetical protein